MVGKRYSIQSRAQRLLLGVALGALALVVLVTALGVFMLRNGTLEVSGELGEGAAHDSRAALEKQITSQLSALAESKAQLGDENFDRIQTQIRTLVDRAEAMLLNPDDYAAVSVSRADPKNDGIVKVQFNSAEGVDLQANADEMGLMGNIAGLLESIAAHNRIVGSVYLGTETGLYFIADDISARKMPTFDPRLRPWYITAKAAGQLTWSDVFDDADGRGLAVTCASPYRDADGNIRGVVGLGSLLNFLSDIVLETKVGDTGYAFVLNERGQMIISPTIQKDVDGKIIREELLESENAALREAAEKMVHAESGMALVEIGGVPHYMAYAPMSVVPWSFAALITVEEALAPATENEQAIMRLTDSALESIDRTILTMLCVFAALVLLVVVAVSIVARRFSSALTHPISQLQSGVSRIAAGQLDERVTVETEDEIGDLARSVNRMAADLKDHINSLQRVTAEKERIGAELSVATQIQASMLPCLFPAFPDRSDFDIYASMDPAKEVGGDFYDFFLVDDDHLCVVIADVSGKGVPAALFMVIAKTLIKNNATNGIAPKAVFEIVNDLLCENNEAGMFVTAFMGCLTLSTCEFRYVNAGHNPPLIRRAGGQYQMLPCKPGFVLAGMEGVRYREESMRLGVGDTLVLYTDGVTEAVNPEDELFGDPRLLEAANAVAAAPPQAFIAKIKQEITRFARGAEQADDITLLALEIKQTGPAMRSIKVDASVDQLPQVLGFIEGELEAVDCQMQVMSQIAIAVEEVFVNIAQYAYAPGSGSATVSIATEGGVVIRFEDTGFAYNPLEKADPDTSLGAEQRQIGGLGIFMVKKLMDDVQYSREDNRNILTIRKAI